MEIPGDGPVAATVVAAVRHGDLQAVRTLLAEHPDLAQVRIRDGRDGTRTLLHVATDWPGYFPNGPDMVHLLVAAGADANAAVTGMWHAETPLHWAASSDDVDVAGALIEGGADIEATGASIGGGTPLDDAVGYGCWHVARLLVERGARVEGLWQAAAMGMMTRVEALMAADPSPSPGEVDHAFWQACHGGQRRVAEYLLGRGADINAVPDHTNHTPLDAARGPDTRRSALISWMLDHEAKGAEELSAG